ncbi:MAG: acyl-CoA thioesterase domain-containing protein, partial [Acidimicrobiia bacterium]
MPDTHPIPAAPYLPTSRADVVESTPLALAGWYEQGQHGGVVAALLARSVEAVPTLAPMEVARLTVELFRVVPLTTLRTEARVVREGKRIQVVEAS